VLRLKRLSIPAVLVAAFALSGFAASSAFAGHKFGGTEAWDPTRHAAAAGDTIHIYSFRQLVIETSNLGNVELRGNAKLESRCGPSSARHWCATAVSYKLATMKSCSHVFGEYIWTFLYVQASGQTAWHQLGHYHDVVVADCA
jgi:hypothetical protein